MCKIKITLLICLLLIGLTLRVQAVDVAFDNDSGDNLWNTAINWSNDALPTSSDDVTIDMDVTLASGQTGAAYWMYVGRYITGDHTLTINGTLTTSYAVAVGYPGYSGIIDVNGGGWYADRGLSVGQGGTGRLNVTNYGFISIPASRTFFVGGDHYGDATVLVDGDGSYIEADLLRIAAISNSVGHLQLNNGGIMQTNSTTAQQLTMAIGGTIDIAGVSAGIPSSGMMRLIGDLRADATLLDYINNGWITAYGGGGNVKVDFVSGYTELTAELLENKVWGINPVNGAVEVEPNDVLSWNPPIPEPNNGTYDVYFGPEGSMEFKGNQSATTYDPLEDLDFSTIYEWRIDVVEGANTYTGNIWKFTTVVPDCVINAADGDFNGDCFINFEDIAQIASSWLKCGKVPATFCP